MHVSSVRQAGHAAPRRSFGRRALSILASGLAISLAANAATIDFESVPSHTIAGAFFESLGLRVTATDSFGGLVYSEGEFGVLNFGNSSTQVMDIGGRGQTTTLTFVNPTNPAHVIGATAVSFLAGDGDLQPETFAVSFLDPQGRLLGSRTYTTSTGGQLVLGLGNMLGGAIGSIQLTLDPNSASGAVIDDLFFTLAPVPEPSMAVLLVLGLIAIGVRKKSARFPDRDAV